MLRTVLSLLVAVVILGLIYLFYPVFVITGKPLLIVNMWNEEVLPKNFRMCTDPLSEENGYHPSLIGLKELRASGSAQFSEKSLNAIIKKIPFKLLTIIDLRQESHGFINGIAVSWFSERNWANKGKTLSEILDDEKLRLIQVAQYPIAILYASKKFPVPIWVNGTHTEAELVAPHGLGYVRIPVADHTKPSNTDADSFINLVKSLPKDSVWLHFHCAAGEGRTTTFLVMYDMMHNANKVKLNDIFQRQHLLGGINFINETFHDWRKNYTEERKLFLRQFYVYCQQNPLFEKSWSSWVSDQQKLNKSITMESKKTGIRSQEIRIESNK